MENNFYKYFDSLKGTISEGEKEFISENVPKNNKKYKNNTKGIVSENEMDFLKKMIPNK